MTLDERIKMVTRLIRSGDLTIHDKHGYQSELRALEIVKRHHDDSRFILALYEGAALVRFEQGERL